MLYRIGAFFQKTAQKARRNRSLFVSFIMSYLVILLIPLVGALSIFFPFRAGLEMELQRSNMLVAEQAKHIVEQTLQNVKFFCTDLSQRERLQSVQRISAPLDAADRYLISRMLAKDMTWSSGINPYVDSYMIYFSKADFFLTSTAYMRPEECYNQYFSTLFPSYEDLRGELSGLAFPRIYNVSDKLVYLYTLSFSGPEPIATTLVTIRKAEVLRPVLAYSWVDKGQFFVLDQNKQIILTNSTQAEYDRLAPFAQSGVNRANGERLVISRTVSDYNGWEYVLVMDGDYLATEQNRMQMVLLFYSLAAVASGILLALLFSRRNYAPIRNVLNVISGAAPGSAASNELADLDTSVRQIVSANADYRNQLAMQAGAIRQNTLSRILRRRIGPEGLARERLHAAGIDFPHERFQLALFRIDDAQGFLLDLDDPAQQFPLDSMDQTLILNIKQGLREEWACYVCEINDRIVCVVNFPHGDEAAVVGHLQAVRARIEKELLVCTTLAVSLIHTAVVSLPTAYEEAGFAMEGVAVSGDANTRIYSPDADGEVNFLSKEMEHALSVALHSGNFADARQVLGEILQKGKDFSTEAYRCLLHSVVTCFLRVLDTAGIHEADLTPQALLKAVGKADGSGEAETLLAETARKICGLLDSAKDSRNNVLMDRILTYIQQNYADTNLSNTEIAAAMDISPAYLSRFFKRHTGDGVLNYTNQLRIEAAKRIMEGNEELTVAEVSAMVGIANAATFIRTFKKHEGITPGRYMELKNKGK